MEVIPSTLLILDLFMATPLRQLKSSHNIALGKLSLVAFFIFLSLWIQGIHAENAIPSVESDKGNADFDASFLNANTIKNVDLSRFAHGSNALPGDYKAAVYINNEAIGTENISIKSRPDKSVYPCITPSLVKAIPFDYEKLPAEVVTAISKAPDCLDLQAGLHDAQVNFDSNEQRLDILIPQLYITHVARGTVNSALWDSGVPALLLGYNLSGYSSSSQGNTYKSAYAGINAGFNLGAWYLRHNGAYNWVENGPSHYSALNTYLQRDIPVLKSRILFGQSNTPGRLFDTLPFSGIQIASDERMLPESLRGYAPEIRGIARTNARVTVSQGGLVIYETTVSPGAFVVSDLYPTGYGGDLNVTVREADGSVQTFQVPYSATTQLLRPGTQQYAMTIGRLRSDSITTTPALYQVTYQRGLTNLFTGYAGGQSSQGYYALQTGIAMGTRFGALAVDVTHAHTELNADTGKSLSGQSYKLSYSNVLPETNSNLSLAAYRFSTEGYMDFMTAMQTRDVEKLGEPIDTISRAKNRLTLTLGQGLPGGWGQAYVSSSLQTYWNKAGSDQQYQVGYNNRYKNLTYGLSISRSADAYGRQQNNYLLSFSFPLSNDDTRNIPQIRFALNRDSGGNNGQQATMSGSAGNESQYSYGVTAINNNRSGASGSVTGQYLSPLSSVSGTLGIGRSYRTTALGASGTIVAHSGGVTVSPYTGDTLGLIEAKGAEGAKVSGYPGIRVDSRGYALVPYLLPYQMNDVYIDPKGTEGDIEFENTAQKVAPYSGAVVKLKYNIKAGTPVLITSQLEGEPLPFGSSVVDHVGNTVGTVGQGGQLYARVEQDKGQLTVSWGEGASMRCTIGYQLAPSIKGKQQRELQRFNTPCLNTKN